MTDLTEAQKLVGHTAKIAAAYLNRNALSVSDVPTLLARVHAALRRLEGPAASPALSDEQRPAVSIPKSVSPDRLFCLECGKSFRSIKRHLKADHQLSPDEYRQKWDLPSDYPMVTPNYSATRSRLAKANGLGRQPRVPMSAGGQKGSPRSARQ